MLTRALLFMALIGATYAACDRHANAMDDRCAADISHAEAVAFEATRTQHACMGPAECRVADELVAASLAQLSAVRRLCSVPAPVVSVADPFEAAEADDSDAAWVVTSQIAEEFARAVLP